MKYDPSGSRWRKWDLHFHTPASFDYQAKSVTNDEIIAGLKIANVSAVAITDHHTMDVARIKILQKLGGDDLTVFPGIEFRSELGGSETVHFIGIFPEDCDVEMIWDKLKGKLDITSQDVAERGDDNIYVPFEKAAQVIHGLGGLITVHAGKKTNSIESIGNTQKFKMAFKKDLAERHIDLLEVKSSIDVSTYWNLVFPRIGFPLPVVVGSDNHNINSYDFPTPCWIKADCTFAGLTHVLHEPKDRVFVGDTPPAMHRVNSNKTKYLRTISVRKCNTSEFGETWFDCAIPLNNGLIAVVGNKGSGKSALADIIGFLGNTKNHGAFSFLSPAKFRQPKSNKSEHFEAESEWESGTTTIRKLSEPIIEEEIERVNYIPQDYLEGVCNELGDAGRGFSRALRQVIYSHVSQADRLGFDSLDELLDYKTKETTDSIEQHKKELTDRIKRFMQLSDHALPTHRKTLENQLLSKQAELAAHDSAKPQDVIKPENDEESKQKITSVEDELRRKETLLLQVEEKLTAAEISKSQFLKQVAAADKLLKRIENLEAAVKIFRDESETDCNLLSVKLEDILTFSINPSKINLERLDCVAKLNAIPQTVGEAEGHGLAFEKSELQKAVKQLRDSLDAPNRRYQEYLFAIGKWKDRRREIEGNEQASGTVNFISHQLKQLDALPVQISKAWDECIGLSQKIYGEIQKLAQAHRVAFGPVQSFVESHPLAKDRFDLRFDAALVPTGFVDRFLAFINQGRKGSFSGVGEGRDRIEMLLAQSEFETTQGIVVFLNSLKDGLTADLRQKPPFPVSVSDQLSKGQNAVELFSFMLGLEYLKPQVTLRWAGKDIDQLSPGERGTLLLVFYLLIDKSDIPLVIDQPEENLDNQTVVDFLVPSVKEAKERRQIILVTHNPNLAVVCDADQVICAYLDKNDGNRISYETGAIENPAINQRIVDILEGTRRAFDNRDGKYHAEKTQSRPRHKALPEKRDN
jgi:ABC-type lipoprotein export system ATPase subunit